MKIAAFEVDRWECGAFRDLERSNAITYTPEPLSLRNAGTYADAEIVSVFIYSFLDAELLARLPRLRLIATRSAGFDHIDVDYCRRHGIGVRNVPGYGMNTVAEHVFGLLLTVSHRLFESIERTRRGNFSLQGLQGFDLTGKTLGVVGTGHIGRYVIKIAGGFGMRVLACDPRPDSGFAASAGFAYVPLDDLLERSDIITLHVPAAKATAGMIADREFSRMKDGVVLINTSRGLVVDIRALVTALMNGKVRAAGLDVLPEEPEIREEAELVRSRFSRANDLENLLADHVLLKMPNVYITPHNAFNTREAIQRILATTVDNIASFIDNRERNVVAAK